MIYHYCPSCGEKYHEPEKQENFFSFFCNKCKFTFYNNPKPGAMAIIFNNENKLLLVKRRNEPFKRDWDLPGGFSEGSENAHDTLRRELKEEIGLVIDYPAKIVESISEKYNNNGNANENYDAISIIHEIRGDFKAENFEALDDISEVCFFELDKLPANIAFPEKEEFLRRYFKE